VKIKLKKVVYVIDVYVLVMSLVNAHIKRRVFIATVIIIGLYVKKGLHLKIS